MDLGVSGLASGFDWRSFIDQMLDVQRTPQKRLASEKNLIQQRHNAYGAIKTQFGVLSSRIDALKTASLFESRAVTSSAADIATVTSTGGSPLGNFSLEVHQLATAARHRGALNAGGAIAATSDVSAVTLSSAGFSTAITAGTFTVNGKQVTIATTDTLQGVFDKISTATGGTVTGAYDPATDKITLTGSSEVILGSATDTSNFLQATKLVNNGTTETSSGGALGGIRRDRTLATANFTTPITGDASNAGEFKINGVSIAYSTTGDSVNNVLDRINNSAAGVTASYDAVNDRFVLTSKSAGDQGIALEDVTGNFLAATGLSGGTLERGKNLEYEIDGGGILTSASNTISEDSSGLQGLSIRVLKEGTTEVSVGSDTDKIKTAINDFITEYNKLQQLIDKNTASTTDSAGKVTAGTLSNEGDASQIASELRAIVARTINESGTLARLASIGIKTNGNDDTLTLDDAEALNTALADNLSGVASLFTNATTGVATKMAAFIENTTGDEGSLIDKQDKLTKQMSDIDKQIADMERLVQDQRLRMIDSFVAMERAQAQTNQQMQFLQRQLGQSNSGSK